jgi:hypothetical protein
MQRNPQHGLDGNDFIDVNLLRSAISYADIVITEKRWTALARDTGLAERWGTTVINLGDPRTAHSPVLASRCSGGRFVALPVPTLRSGLAA